MVQVLGFLVIAFGVLLVVGGLTGRVKLRNCCSIADPRNDLRMRDAFIDEADDLAPEPPSRGRSS